MYRSRITSTSQPWSLIVLVAAMLFLVGCGGQMGEQPRCDPYEESSFFANGQCVRQLVPNTVARGELQDDSLLYTGRGSDTLEEVPDASETVEGGEGDDSSSQSESSEQDSEQNQQAQFSTEFPFPVTMEVLERGQERYNIYCAPCHSMDGSGDGMVVRRGFPAPPSFHIERLREVEVGYLYDIITNGIGAMPDYEGQIQNPADRWAIVAYMRALQLSQNATIDDVPAEEQGSLDEPTEEATEESAPED